MADAYLASIAKVDLTSDLFRYEIDERPLAPAELMDGKLLLVTNVAHLMPAELCSATRHNYRARPAGLKGATAAMSVVQRLRLYV